MSHTVPHGYKYRAIAEHALGRSLSASHPIHHVNRNDLDDQNTNLVICQDAAYHKLLHTRTEAFYATGYADWRKCVICKEWGPPSEVIDRRYSYHRRCSTEKAKARQRAAVASGNCVSCRTPVGRRGERRCAVHKEEHRRKSLERYYRLSGRIPPPQTSVRKIVRVADREKAEEAQPKPEGVPCYVD